MSEPLTFSIGLDGDVTVRTFDELDRWLAKERARWDWLAPGDGRTDRHNVAANVQQAWDNVLAAVANHKAQGQPLEQLQPHLGPLAGGIILISTTNNGSTVLDILQSAGDLPASFAAGFINGQITMRNAQTADDLLGALLTIIPDLSKPVDWSDHLKRERTNFRMATRSLIERVDQEADQRNRANGELVARASKIGRRIFDLKRSQWRSAQATWQSGATTAVDQIKLTDSTFKEFMKLKAPVEYWQAKAAEHLGREAAARARLYWFFPITVIVVIGAFVWTGNFLIDHPDTAANKAPIALYVVVSGGLLLLSTIAFWIGRLLTKLYLSEHHLRNDAEERAVMTTTYLALTNESGAPDSDRQIILNALFRATPDGIVRDDGPSDPGLQGLLAKLLAR